MGEWLGRLLAVLSVDGSSLLTASQISDGLNFSYALLLFIRVDLSRTPATLRPGLGNK